MPHPIVASAEVKMLRKRIKEIGVQISAWNEERQRLQSLMTKANAEIRKLKDRLKTLEGQDIEVTDHAILRYLERVKGIDPQAVAESMITPELRQQVETLGGTGKFPGPNGTRLVLENKRIISVVPK